MTEVKQEQFLEQQVRTGKLLRQLGVPVHRAGYKQLCVALPCFARDDTQMLTKELYPQVAAYFGNTDRRNVEHSIRTAIEDAWQHRDPDVWEDYFPRCEKAPTNQRFLSTLVEFLQ